MTDFDFETPVEEAVTPSPGECVAMWFEARAMYDRAVKLNNEAGEMFLASIEKNRTVIRTAKEATVMLKETIRLNQTAMIDMAPLSLPN